MRKIRTDDEHGRQCALDMTGVLDTPREPEFERITSLVCSIFSTPVAAVSLIDRRRQWFKSVQGLDVAETGRDVAFCDHTIRQARCLKVEDATKDPRFAANPLVTGEPGIRAYMGAPLRTPDGYQIGALCVIDFEPRSFTAEQERVLESFAEIVMSEIELRQSATLDDLTRLGNRRAFRDCLAEDAAEALILVDLDRFKAINDTHGHAAGDAVLAAAAAVLRDRCGADAVACRVGGEEFGIVLERTSGAAAVTLAERLRADIAAMEVPQIGPARVTASFGVAVRHEAEAIADWRDRADGALYEAKAAGRDRVVSAEDAHQARCA